MSPARSLAFAILMLGTLVPVAFLPTVAAFTNGTDDFESKFGGQNPSAPFYTYTSGTCGTATSTAFAHGGTKSALVGSDILQNGCTAAHFNFGTSAYNAPAGITVSFYLYLTPTGNANTPTQGFSMLLRGGEGESIQFQQVGAPATSYTAYAQHCLQVFPGTCTAGATIPGITLNAWHLVQLTNFNECGNASGFLVVIDGQASQDTTTYCSTTNPRVFDLTWSTFTSSSISPRIYVDDLTLSGAASVAPTVGAAATTTTTMALTGFDVDPMDRVVIARSSDGGTGGDPSAIRVFDSQTLAQTGVSPLSNKCNKLDGVMAYSQDPPGIGYTGFLDCTVSSTQTNFFKVRNVLLGNPDQSDTVCSDFCDFDMQTQTDGAVCPGSTTNTLPGGSTAIGNIVAAPISWRSGYNIDGSPFSGSHATGDSALVAFAFTDTGNGNVGIWAINQLNNISPDESCGVSVAFGGATATKQLCTWRGPDGKDYLTAVSDTTSGLTWRTDVSVVSSDNGHTQPNVAITQVFPFSSPYNLAVGVGCTGEYNYVLTAAGVVAPVKVLGTSLGSSPWQKTGAYAAQRGIAVSRDGLRLAYTSDSTHATVLNATNGNTACTLTMPTGTFREMRLDDTARNLYVATSTKISRYDLAGSGCADNHPLGTRGSGTTQCTVTSAGTCGTPGGIVPTNTFTGTGNQAVAAHAAGQAFGGGDTGGGLIISIIYILGFGVMGSSLLADGRKPSLAGFIIGGVLGFAYSVYSDLVPGIITFLVVAVCVGLAVMKFTGRSSGGSDS